MRDAADRTGILRQTAVPVVLAVLLLVLGTVPAPAQGGQARRSPTPARSPSPPATNAQVTAAVDAAFAKYKHLKDGRNANYIPALAKVDPNLFGIAVVTADGKVYTAGNATTEVSIQAISTVFTMALVMNQQGPDAILKTIGADATDMRFNSIVSAEFTEKMPGGPVMNSLVNPGAIATTSMVQGRTADEIWGTVSRFYGDFAGRPLKILDDVYRSGAASNQRNQATGMLMYSYGYIKANPNQATDIYSRQSSMGVNVRDLATMAATLAFGGTNPVTKRQVLKPSNVPHVLAVMATAGLYDNSGKWLWRTGLPAKSGTGGGIIAVSPGNFGIAVISPPLDDVGNSVRAQMAIADISNALGGNPYARTGPAQ